MPADKQKVREKKVTEQQRKARAIEAAIDHWLRSGPQRTQVMLAQEIGKVLGKTLSTRAISKWKKSGQISGENLFAFAQVTNCDPKDLNAGRFVPVIPHDVTRALPMAYNDKRGYILEPAGEVGIRTRVPIIGDTERGPGMNFDGATATHYLQTPCNDEKSYALRVRGTGLHPRYKEGEVLCVTPRIVPQPSDEVVVRWNDERFGVYVLAYWVGDEIGLSNVVSDTAPRIACTTDDMQYMHRVGPAGKATDIKKYGESE